MANDFSADPTCISLYRFESDPITVDSKGTNTLTEAGTNPSTDASFFQEGSTSGLLHASGLEYLYRTDANLTAAFPLKSSTSNLTISLCSWFRTVGTAGYRLAFKSDFSGHRSWGLMTENQAGTQRMLLDLGKTDGTFSEQLTHASGLSANTWYHITATYRDSDLLIALRLRDTAGAIIGSDTTATAANHLAVWSQVDFMLGTGGSGAAPSGGYWDGYLDEVVVFTKALTATDSTNIAKGLYSGTGEAQSVGQMWLH